MLQKNSINALGKYFLFFLIFFNINQNLTKLNFYCVLIYFKSLSNIDLITYKKKKKNYVYKKKFSLSVFELKLQNALITNSFFKNSKISKKVKNITNTQFYNYFLKKYLKKRQLVKNFLYSKVFNYPQFWVIKKPYKAFTLKQRHFIVKDVLMRRLFSFLVKHSAVNKTFLSSKFFKKKKVFLMNMHKKLAWKMHKARVVHWNFSTKGQLNKYRYNKLLATALSFLTKNSSITFLIFLLFSFYTFISSYKQILLLFKKNLIVYNGDFLYTNINMQVGDIIELPFGSSLANSAKKTLGYAHNKRLKKLTYKFLKNKKKKHIPKIYKKSLFFNTLKTDFLAYDPALNIIGVIYKMPRYNYNLNKELLKSSVIGLQNWKYEFQ